jgi:hypothetical protein
MGFFRSLYDNVKNKLSDWKNKGFRTVYDDVKNVVHSGINKVKTVFDAVNGGRKMLESVPFFGKYIKPFGETFDTASDIIDTGSNLLNRGMRVGDDIVDGRNINNASVDIMKSQGSNVLDNISKLKNNLLNRRQK